ncbi:MerR family transcriptional regulator [Streptomyces sp. RS10V-4]|uniref:MerR family transcriptional regulator n=1 Tax=Streptomyces rhizoryzae TaxID=2932493 RepID=UPI002002DD60|nr:MerR family transcriptional regulator [Streptomyces rhizoryzae]MCK7621774.1 MerR family transcriptional regulator [Streptomyces rhizoryzae]
MRIGELARTTGVTTRALRYYEEQGLLRPDRTANGYRSYGEGAVRVVENIRLLLAAGLTTEDLRLLDGCLRDELTGGHRCADPAPKIEVFEQRLALLQARIADLAAVRDQLLDRLADLRGQSGGAGQPDRTGQPRRAAPGGCPDAAAHTVPAAA